MSAVSEIISATGIGRNKYYQEQWAEIASALNLDGGTLIDLGAGPGLNALDFQNNMQKQEHGFAQVHAFDLGSMDGYKQAHLIDFRPQKNGKFTITPEIEKELAEKIQLHFGHDLRTTTITENAPELLNSPQPHVYVLHNVISHMIPEQKGAVLGRVGDIAANDNVNSSPPRSFLIMNDDLWFNKSMFRSGESGIMILDLNYGVPLCTSVGKNLADKLGIYQSICVNGDKLSHSQHDTLQEQTFPTRDELFAAIRSERTIDHQRQAKYIPQISDEKYKQIYTQVELSEVASAGGMGRKK